MARSKRQDLQINRHRKEGTSWRTNLQVSIKEGKKAAVYPGFQAINTPCYILDILISFKTAQGTELSISPFQTPLCDPSAPALHSWPLMKTLLKLKQRKLCQLMTKAWLYWCLFFHTHMVKSKTMMQEQEINGFLLLCNPWNAFVVPYQMKELPLSKLPARTYTRVTSSLIKFSLSNRYSIHESRSLWGNVDLQVGMLSSSTQPWLNCTHQAARKGNHLFRIYGSRGHEGAQAPTHFCQLFQSWHWERDTCKEN